MLTSAVAAVLAAVFLFLALLHLYWGIGGEWASTVVLPMKEDGSLVFKPGFIACSGVAVLLMAAAYIVSESQGLLPPVLGPQLTSLALGVMAAVFVLRTIGDFKYCGLAKKVTSTEFARMDTRLFTPFCAVSAVLILFLLIS